MRDETVIDSPVNNRTVGERWKPHVEGHWYNGACEFVKEHLGAGSGSCLVIGSPLFEVRALEALGWAVTYLDCRWPPARLERFVLGDATKTGLSPQSFNAVSSTCVLCHAGLGRYGDSIDLDHGDEKMLGEIKRVLKPGGRASLMFGPVVDMEKSLRHGTEHRIYTIPEAKRMILEAGFNLIELRVWNTVLKMWRLSIESPTSNIDNCDYLCVALTH